jgi:hypothetical protein
VDAEGRQESESISGVLGLALGLALIGCAFWSFSSSSHAEILDGDELLSERFEFEALPFGFEALEAFRLTGGEEIVLLRDPDAEPLDIAVPIEALFEGGGGDGGGDEWSDRGGRGGRGRGRGGRGGGHGGGGDGEKKDNVWSKLEEGEAGHSPSEMVIAWYEYDDAEAVLKRQFSGARYGDISDVSDKGGRLVVDSGEVNWGAYSTFFLRERVFRKVDDVPGFYDTMRVNLTLGTRCCVLYAIWAPGRLGSKESISEALRHLRPLPPPPASQAVDKQG